MQKSTIQHYWKLKIGGVPAPLIGLTGVAICVLLATVAQLLRPTPLDINSPAVFAQVPTGKPLKAVTAQQVIDYLQGHGIALSEVKPFTLSALKPDQALTFKLESQTAVILSYADTNSMLRDRALFPDAAASTLVPIAGRKGSGAPSPDTSQAAARPTSALFVRWNMNSRGNVLLLTDKNMTSDLRSALLSHLNTLIVAPSRPTYPTATQAPANK
jgi:hypothetical protein